MAEMLTFNPAFGTGVTITTGASAATIVPGFQRGLTSLCFTNLGSETVYVRTGDANAVATAADYPVLGSQQVTITSNADFSHVATFSSAAGSLHVMRGQGF
jgi:hypothetical protein